MLKSYIRSVFDNITTRYSVWYHDGTELLIGFIATLHLMFH